MSQARRFLRAMPADLRQTALKALADETAPRFWQRESSGVLKPAVQGYLSGRPMTLREIAAMQAYFRRWINAPGWQGDRLPELRRQVEKIRTRADIDQWLRSALNEGIDPL